MTKLEPTRRSVIKAGAWTAPVVVAVTAAPALAASTRVRGQLRTGRPDASSTYVEGAVTNPTGTSVTVTITLRHTCDTGGFSSGAYRPEGWTTTFVGFDTANGSATGSIRIEGSITVAGGATVPTPYVTGSVPETVTGTSSATLAVAAPASVTQPSAVAWPTTVGGVVQGARLAGVIELRNPGA